MLNDLVGYYVLLMIYVNSSQVLWIWYCMYLEVSSYGFLSVVLYTFMLLFSQFSLMFCCDVTMRAAENLLVTCYNLQEKYHSSSMEFKELDNFANKLINRKIKFTAANYFDINRSTMFGLFWNITTCFIALVQFDSAKTKTVNT
nr:gustatory receptor 9 [Pachyrhinus yasumatsui]